MYIEGRGVAQNYKEALNLFQKAAEQEDSKAQYNLGVMYGKGQGVIQDNIHAYMWLIIAASNGNAGAVKSMELVRGGDVSITN